jgi:hypothetical protein
MANTSYVVLNTIAGSNDPLFVASLEHVATYGLHTSDVCKAQVWTTLPLAEQLVAELNALVPAAMRSYYNPSVLWRVEPLADWAAT